MSLRTAILFLALALVACGEEKPEPVDERIDERARLEARGFTEVEIAARRADGALEFEAMKDGERCIGEARFGPNDEARIATRCGHAESIEALERACEQDPNACIDAAAAVRDAPPIDWPRATRSSARACEAGLDRECLYVGMAYELGERGVAKDPDAARALYRRACEAGAPSACARLRGLEE